jgi:hypothetical protein
MVSIGFDLFTAFSLLAGAINCLMISRVKFPDPPGADHISEGPYNKARRRYDTYKSRALWAFTAGIISLGVSLTMLGSGRQTVAAHHAVRLCSTSGPTRPRLCSPPVR